jgi:hypothetical protein
MGEQKVKVKRLEKQNAQHTSKCIFVNNQLFKVNLGFTFSAKGKPKWMEKNLMKNLDEKSCMNNQPRYILVLYTNIQVGY